MSEKTAAGVIGMAEAACDPCRPKPRDRIVTTARDLFHKHGIRSIGVETIAEAAGTNKMTLYRHFGSKDDLIVACLTTVADDAEVAWHTIEVAHPDDPMARLRAWVQHGAACMTRDERGCALANAAVELTEADHPARRMIEQVKTAHRNRLVAVCRDAGIAQAELLADTLSLLFEGARVSRQSVGAEGPCCEIQRMSEAVIAAFVPH